MTLRRKRREHGYDMSPGSAARLHMSLASSAKARRHIYQLNSLRGRLWLLASAALIDLRIVPNLANQLYKTRYLSALVAYERDGGLVPNAPAIRISQRSSAWQAFALSQLMCEIGLFRECHRHYVQGQLLIRNPALDVRALIADVSTTRLAVSQPIGGQERSFRNLETFYLVRNAICDDYPGWEEGERCFRQTVSGRDVVVVGASSRGDSDLPRSQDADARIVVQLKVFAGRDGNWAGISARPRADVVYYVSRHARMIESLLLQDDGLERTGLSDTRVLVFLSGPPRSPLPLPVRPLKFSPHLVLGSCQIGQRAILDILSYRPRSVHLVGFDGYLSSQIDHAYRSRLSGRTSFLRAINSFSGHDLFGNRRLLQQLWRSGLVSLDKQTYEYLAMTEDDYACCLERSLRREFMSPREPAVND